MTAELYDPKTGSWTPTGSMGTPRSGAASVLLKDGRVLVAGGASRTCCSTLSTAEVYDADQETWARIASMADQRGSFTATMLDDGRVLVAAGYSSIYCDAACSWTFPREGELYTP